ncbi:proteasome inhibitor [Echinococcus multilocularis]|uniref:Proteasome inhibitor n=1 Tax=Echinococcus multilocularis TaxID=6211 RepID=A0A068YIE2_ECHMU|nr:proteasome inhibitor [Echinococcus multilocularis]
MSSAEKEVRLSLVESSILDYVINLHGAQANGRRSVFIALLSHACLIARGAKLLGTSHLQSASILPNEWALNDPIRINYRLQDVMDVTLGTSARNSPEQVLQLSATETDDHVFVNLTNTTTDKFGHLELSGPAHVRLEAASSGGVLQPCEIFSQLEFTLSEMDENLWKVVLPKPAKSSSRGVPFDPLPPNVLHSPPNRSVSGVDPVLQGYGRSDLDPLGVDDWTQRLGGTGGMVIDPTQALRQPRNPFGLPRPDGFGGIGGMVPPGSRFDPIGPPMIPPRSIGPRGSRFNNPDPDSALPPGWEDMYM